MEVRVRYAPSPTGLQHIGGVRTALYNYFFARANQGKFILRVEDTDRTRYTDEALQDLYDTLDWLGIDYDEGPRVGGPFGPYVQSERFELYKKYAEQLVKDGKAYYCYCTEERLESLRSAQTEAKSEEQGYDRHCRNLTSEQIEANEKAGIPHVIRLKVPMEGKTTFHDVLMGDITRKNSDVSPDPVLLKSDGFPTYHLANVIDDHLMGVTHIMRAQEWIPSGPLHILLYQAFGWEPPMYCHLPMVMGKDGKKLSKRHGSTSVRDFREQGYLPEALLNYVSLVGWSFDGQREFFSKEELSQVFTLEKINKAPGVFDYKKLDWFNGQYIRLKTDEELARLLVPFMEKAGLLDQAPDKLEAALRVAPLVKERLRLLGDIGPMVSFLFKDPGEPSLESLLPKGQDAQSTYLALSKAYPVLRQGLESGEPESQIEEKLSNLALELGLKVNGVFMPIRVSITGSTVSPPLFDCIRALGYDKSFERIQRSIKVLEENK
ncbi:MAG: glutamate--tRNA ligase [Sphaerochaetaceae bacterium]|jgi:glutamyl-tRNA synthetase